MKKFVSALLSLVILVGVCGGFASNAYAAGFTSYARSININQTYTESASVSDHKLYNGNTYYYDAFYFNVPSNSRVTVNVNSPNEQYLCTYNVPIYEIYSGSNTSNPIWSQANFDNMWYNSGQGRYQGTYSLNLNAGSYYFVAKYVDWVVSDGYYWGSFNFQISVPLNGWQYINGRTYYYKNGKPQVSSDHRRQYVLF